MFFAFDEQQQQMQSQLRSFAERYCSVSEIRNAWSSQKGWSDERWSQLAAMGVVGLSVPEQLGGLGLGLVDLVGLLEEAGRAGLPEPLLETTGLAVPLLLDIPTDSGRAIAEQWLPKVVSGDAVLSMGLSTMPAVAVAAEADLLLMVVDQANAGPDALCEVHALEPAGVSLRPRASVDGSRRLAEVSWERSERTLIASGPLAAAALAGLRRRAALCTGALLLGVADRLIAMAASYATERHQFGKPIGSFQAVKHHLADALIALEAARPAVYRAAWSMTENEETAERDASMAKACAAEAAELASRVAIQVHGAIGYTWECDVHLWAKRAWALINAWGDAAQHRSIVLRELLAGRL